MCRWNAEELATHNVDLSEATIEDANLKGLRIDGVLVTELFRVYRARATDVP